MKIAVSVPDELFARADELAAELGLSRSEVYARALGEFVESHGSDDDPVTAKLNELADLHDPQAETPSVGTTAARRLIETGQWAW